MGKVELNAPTTIAQVAEALCVSQGKVKGDALLGKWKYTEQPTRSRHKKRLYSLKHLPPAIAQAVLTLRHAKSGGQMPCLPKVDPGRQAINQLKALTGGKRLGAMVTLGALRQLAKQGINLNRLLTGQGDSGVGNG